MFTYREFPVRVEFPDDGVLYKMLTYHEFPVRVEFPDEGVLYKMLTYREFPVRVEFPDDGVLYQDTGFQSGGTSQHQSCDVIYTQMETSLQSMTNKTFLKRFLF